MLPMQLVPWIAQRTGWRWGFAILTLGPLAGIAAIRRFATVRDVVRPQVALSTEP